MPCACRSAALWALLACAAPASAGLHYSGERFAELPSQWQGFLIDHRLLRNLAVEPTLNLPASPMRKQYKEAASLLEKTAATRQLTADELADLGALYLRLGELAKAITLLRQGQRDHVDHFQITANLGTAWQLQGNLDAAAACLEQAVKLAPEKLRKAEQYHLRLVRFRQRQRAGTCNLDDLFGVRYQAEGGGYEPGKLADAERKKLPADAVAVVQQLALWLPADGLLLWQLAELANAHGDFNTAAAIMDGCVSEFGLRTAELRQRRQVTRAAADELAKSKPALALSKAAHAGHLAGLKPRSRRPLVNRLDAAALPAVNPTGVNLLPWSVLGETSIDRKFPPGFPSYLQELDGKQVTLRGHVQPLGDDPDINVFLLIEYPVGCWFCETPGLTGIIRVELPEDQSIAYTRNAIRATGKLVLNRSDPENFLFILRDAKVSQEE